MEPRVGGFRSPFHICCATFAKNVAGYLTFRYGGERWKYHRQRGRQLRQRGTSGDDCDGCMWNKQPCILRGHSSNRYLSYDALFHSPSFLCCRCWHSWSGPIAPAAHHEGTDPVCHVHQNNNQPKNACDINIRKEGVRQKSGKHNGGYR